MKKYTLFIISTLLILYLLTSCSKDYKTYQTNDFSINIPISFKHYPLIDDTTELQLVDKDKNIYLVIEKTSIANYFPNIEKTADSIINSAFYYVKDLKTEIKTSKNDTIYYLNFKEYDTGTEFNWDIIIAKTNKNYLILWLWYIPSAKNEKLIKQIIKSFEIKN